jgi:hypothetical protein
VIQFLAGEFGLLIDSGPQGHSKQLRSSLQYTHHVLSRNAMFSYQIDRLLSKVINDGQQLGGLPLASASLMKSKIQ